MLRQKSSPKLQREVVRIITGLSERVQFGIVFFDADVFKFPPSGKPAESSVLNRR